ncbi:ribosomal RNA small subunit methyltransferase, mitochondrial [Sesamum indicum]|uniref:rRNA adenine N(6)-methyltransferase n=1 Tax=Sesamum indicum TaxID=4182 RepID=A0A6I9TEJ5_SESIN|nr:ribosomal RNA small subunit methyltransferase, mitochondrial [Sesamum indicum]
MLHRRKSLSDRLLNPSFGGQFLSRCLRKKSSRGYGDDVCRKSKAGKHGEQDEEKEGRVRLLKSRGQHLLTNPRVLDSIVRTSDIKPDDTVLEIGPGTGNLTLKLLEAARRVVAVEIDNRMVEILRKRAAERGFQDRLNIVSGDALKTKFPEFNLVVANIPYGISSPLLAKLVYGVNVNPFRSATLLLQKEFARRLLAKPGDSEFNRLAVNMKLVAELEFVMDVSKRDFVPCPKVDSSVIKIYPKSEIPDVDLEEWWAFTRTCFSKKNKTLGATLKQKRKLMELMKLSKAEVFADDGNPECHDDGDEECDSDEGSSDSSLNSGTGIGLFRTKIVRILGSGGFLEKRPSKLSNDELLQLLSLLNGAGIYFHDGTKKKDTCEAAFAACDDLL